MDPRGGQPSMRAPSRSSPQVSLPSIADRLVEPETREAVLRGRRLYAERSNPEHGDPHVHIDVVLGTNAKPGYVGSTDLLTRVADDGDFATGDDARLTRWAVRAATSASVDETLSG